VRNLKLTCGAPEWFDLRHGEHAFNHDVYKTKDEYFDDIAKAYREELDVLYKAGLRNVQFDDPLLAYFCSESMLSGMQEVGEDSELLLDKYIKLYNGCIRDVPKDMNIGLHLCRGNFKNGMHFSEGGYDRISRKLFREINVTTYYLEYDTPRAGSFEPLKELPEDKVVILGVVSTKTREVESIDAMKARVYEAADTIAKGTGRTREAALNQLGVSTQCGMASHSEGNAITPEVQKAKLELVVKIAKDIWPDA